MVNGTRIKHNSLLHVSFRIQLNDSAKKFVDIHFVVFFCFRSGIKLQKDNKSIIEKNHIKKFHYVILASANKPDAMPKITYFYIILACKYAYTTQTHPLMCIVHLYVSNAQLFELSSLFFFFLLRFLFLIAVKIISTNENIIFL